MGWRPARGWAGQGGARAAQRVAKAHAGLDEQAFVRVAQQSRQRAHAEERSARLLLTHIHVAYQIDTPKQSFIRTFRRFPLPVLTVDRTRELLAFSLTAEFRGMNPACQEATAYWPISQSPRYG